MSIILIWMKWIDHLWAHLMQFLTPCSRGKNHKITISPHCSLWLVCPLGHTFRCVFLMGLHPSCTAMPTFLALGDMDVFLPLFHSHTWYIHSHCLVCCSHLFLHYLELIESLTAPWKLLGMALSLIHRGGQIHFCAICYVRIPKESGHIWGRRVGGRECVRLIVIDYHTATHCQDMIFLNSYFDQFYTPSLNAYPFTSPMFPL